MHGTTKRGRIVVRLAADHIFSVSTLSNSLFNFFSLCFPHGRRTYVSGVNILDRGGGRRRRLPACLQHALACARSTVARAGRGGGPRALGISPILPAALLATTGAAG
jgi:hypothetical protein